MSSRTDNEQHRINKINEDLLLCVKINYFNNYQKQQPHQPSSQMNNFFLKPQQSCTEIGKYKFIPPNKQPKTKNSHHFNSLIQPNTSIIEEQCIKQQQSRPHLKIKNVDRENDQGEKSVKKKQDKILRSISNTRLQTSNSRNAGLTQKTQPCQGYRNQIYLDRLNQVIQQMEDKDMQKNSQIAALRQQNRNLHLKLQKNASQISLKTKQISELTVKIQHLQCQMRQKTEQHSLIIDSLKKVIESQLTKINQMKVKITKLEKVRLHLNSEFSKVNDNLIEQPREHINCQKSLKSQGKFEKGKNFIKSIRRCMNESRKNLRENDQTLDETKISQTEKIIQHSKSNPTPDFGARTPSSVDDEQYSSEIESEQYQQNPNLTLSRISESLEQDIETSRDNIEKLETNKHNKVSTHQQLLDQIDLYLSKRTNIQSQKFRR